MRKFSQDCVVLWAKCPGSEPERSAWQNPASEVIWEGSGCSTAVFTLRAQVKFLTSLASASKHSWRICLQNLFAVYGLWCAVAFLFWPFSLYWILGPPLLLQMHYAHLLTGIDQASHPSCHERAAPSPAATFHVPQRVGWELGSVCRATHRPWGSRAVVSLSLST